MNTKIVATNYQMQEWMDIIRDCCNSGYKVYEYINHILSVLPKHMEDTDYSFINDLLTWSEKIPEECKKQTKK